MLQVLDRVGLKYDVDDNGLYLLRTPGAVAKAKEVARTVKEAQRGAKDPPLRWTWQSRTVRVWEEWWTVGGFLRRVPVDHLRVEGLLENRNTKLLRRGVLVVRLWERKPFGMIVNGQSPDENYAQESAEVTDLPPGGAVPWSCEFGWEFAVLKVPEQYVRVDLLAADWAE
jgi:hypothetical protein